jgi:hypothetical protein
MHGIKHLKSISEMNNEPVIILVDKVNEQAIVVVEPNSTNQ